ncbi:hypothetical protein [Bradyrhizobium sp. SYSU BS000235]|uniref:hypothetical protein n=1 Tax=Bradyrhizobium sp. SYSU BS000235 TaxID=3411332 RepID=UPI003C7730B8
MGILRAGGLVLVAGFMFTMSALAYANDVLITDDEAKLPPVKESSEKTRGITRGPRIEYLADGNAAHSPIHFRVKFQSFGGARIDTESLKVTYVKNPTVDLTPRVKPFTQPTGIDMPNAVLPPGNHVLRIDLKDSDGRTAATSFTLKIVP